MTALDPAERAGQSRKLAAARASIAASALLALAKLVAGLWSGSLALLSEAGHAFVDTGATVLTFYAPTGCSTRTSWSRCPSPVRRWRWWRATGSSIPSASISMR